VRPEWMILTVLPVLPPDLRPVVQLDGIRLASADLNDLYRRVIARNQRLKVLMDAGAPGLILRNEMRLLQEAVDALFDNGRRGRAATGQDARGGRALKSLAAMLRGKQGRFRENLLGKRVDYSGRSVIVVGPDLKLNQVGLPKTMALELFKPFVMRRLVEEHYAINTKSARRIVHEGRPEVWDVLEEVIRDHPVLLNRSPTLHKLNLMSFLPTLIEGNAIQLHPLVCSVFNADFDGDTMAVHVPLSPAAREEARQLLLSTCNVLSPATGEPTYGASQDMVLGCYYLTRERPGAKGEGRLFSDTTEALLAYEHGVVDLQARIRVRLDDFEVFDQPPPAGATARVASSARAQIAATTVGRVIFNEALPNWLRFKNYPMTKETLRQLLSECFREYGRATTAQLADEIKRLGFTYGTKAGVTIAISDIKVPAGKQEELARADGRIAELDEHFAEGLITESERYQQVVDIWNGATDTVARMVEASLDPYGSIYTIAKSGATKAKLQQIRQLSGMRGLMASPSGRIIDVPIRGNFREGLSVLEYFISSHGARKGLADTALRTAEAGHLTRRLVDVSQDAIVTEEDCGTSEGLLITEEGSRAMGLETMRPRLIGRVLAEAITGQGGLDVGMELSEDVVDRVLALGYKALRVRSPLTCQARRGLCRKCYGRDLSTGRLVSLGTAVGIIAAQSIGEPGTQLTLRTFHTGGIAGAQGDITQGLPRVEELFEARVPKEKAILSEAAGVVEVVTAGQANGGCTIRVVATIQGADEYPLQEGGQLLVKAGERVELNQVIALLPGTPGGESVPVLARVQGKAGFSASGVLTVSYEEREAWSCQVPAKNAVVVQTGQAVRAGTPLTRGSPDPQDILRIAGRNAVQLYLLQEVQRVYRNTGVYIDDKHAEVVIRQMLRRVQIDQPGDSQFLPGEVVDRLALAQVNAAVLAEGGEPATARTMLLGITKASLAAESWLAAASFQETTRVLTRAAVFSQLDPLVGLKENLILGKLIPAGTGLEARRRPRGHPGGEMPSPSPQGKARVEGGELIYV
jgi:DNA-directed RNA polymerase subunit beta'